jgi:membrane-associated phospholipid phosphatase
MVDRKWLTYGLLYVYVTIGYFLTNKFLIFEARSLPLLTLDQMIPFSAVWGWIYITVYLMPLAAAFTVKDPFTIRQMIKAFFFSSTLCFLFFLVYPTHFPRTHTLPGISEGFDLATLALQAVVALDSPTNCFPSLHVAYSFLPAFYVKGTAPRLSQFLFGWSVLISFSTLFTKQHYSLDVVAGFALAFVAFRYFSPEPIAPPLASHQLKAANDLD